MYGVNDDLQSPTQDHKWSVFFRIKNKFFQHPSQKAISEGYKSTNPRLRASGDVHRFQKIQKTSFFSQKLHRLQFSSIFLLLLCCQLRLLCSSCSSFEESSLAVRKDFVFATVLCCVDTWLLFGHFLLFKWTFYLEMRSRSKCDFSGSFSE